MPSGIVVENNDTRSKYMNREAALKELESRVAAYLQERQNKKART